MKKQISIFCAVFFIASEFCAVNAQSIAYNTRNRPAGPTATAIVAEEKISDNVQKKFKKAFPVVTGEIWAKIDNGYRVVFTNGHVQTRVYLDGRGNVRFRISYYTEAELPADIRMRVKSVYYDYNILSVQEINLGKTKFYLVSVEDAKSWKIIRIDENDMEVYKEYVKM